MAGGITTTAMYSSNPGLLVFLTLWNAPITAVSHD